MFHTGLVTGQWSRPTAFFLESGISLNKTNKAPKEDEENSNAIGRGLRKLSTMFTVFQWRNPRIHKYK